MLKQQLVRLGALLMPLALSVFPLAASAQTLLSQGKPVVASSQEGAWLAPTMAVDGNAGTRWGSVFADPQWIMVDLGGGDQLIVSSGDFIKIILVDIVLSLLLTHVIFIDIVQR